MTRERVEFTDEGLIHISGQGNW